MDLINGLPTGAVRVSFGYMSTVTDARVCLRFITDSFLEQPKAIPTFPNPEWYKTATGDDVTTKSELRKLKEETTTVLQKNTEHKESKYILSVV